MFFIFLVVFETMTASFVVEDRDTCRALQTLNRAYWDEQGGIAQARRAPALQALSMPAISAMNWCRMSGCSAIATCRSDFE
jgi:hypothetical protein